MKEQTTLKIDLLINNGDGEIKDGYNGNSPGFIDIKELLLSKMTEETRYSLDITLTTIT